MFYFYQEVFPVKQIVIEPQAEVLLKKYEMLVRKWQKAVNLVSSHSLDDFWKRHILDSAQLYQYVPQNAKIMVDMGSGGGFPALVLAVLNLVNKGPLTDIYLVESDVKKCVFLTEAARELDINIHVLNQRLETVDGIMADIVTSRALASIGKLLELAQPFTGKQTEFLFLKGAQTETELRENNISCRVELFKSKTDEQGKIVRIREVIYND